MPEIPRTRIGVGFHAIPTLGEWRQCLKYLEQEIEAGSRVLRPHSARDGDRRGLDFVGINPGKALHWTAVINGLLARSFSLQSWLSLQTRTDAGPTDFALGIGRRGKCPLRRGHVFCVDCRRRCRAAPQF
jgi:hypothetical protein